ncbi:MAG: hypothetical protein SGPRY_014829 [Prymnesium sp.]
MRPAPYPADAASRQAAAMAAQEELGSKPIVKAFSGQGHTLAGPSSISDPPDESMQQQEWQMLSRQLPQVAPGRRRGSSLSPSLCLIVEIDCLQHSCQSEPILFSPQLSLQVDESAPTTVVQVRLTGLAPVVFRLNASHTVADLKALIESKLSEAGEPPRAYTISSGFPPKRLSADDMTLEAAGLLSAAVTHRWS